MAYISPENKATVMKAAAKLEETATNDTPAPGDKRDHLRQAMEAYQEARSALDQAFSAVTKDTLETQMIEIRKRQKDLDAKAITFKDAYFEATLDANTCAQVRDTPIHALLELAKNMLNDAPAPGQRRKKP